MCEHEAAQHKKEIHGEVTTARLESPQDISVITGNNECGNAAHTVQADKRQMGSGV